MKEPAFHRADPRLPERIIGAEQGSRARQVEDIVAPLAQARRVVILGMSLRVGTGEGRV